MLDRDRYMTTDFKCDASSKHLCRVYPFPKLEHAMPIIPHANGKLFVKRSSSYSQFAMIVLVVWSVNSDGIVLLLPRLVPID